MVLRTKPEKKEEKERTRLALLRAALGLAATFGFASLSLREVSREAAIAPTSFYRHFGDMEELGLAIIQEAVDPALRGVTDACRRASGPKRDVAQSLLEALLAAIAEDPALFRFFFAERVGGSKVFRTALAGAVRRFTEDLERTLLERGGSTPSPSSVSAVAQATVTVALESGFESLDVPSDGRAALLARARAQMKLIATGASLAGTQRAGGGQEPR